MRINGRYRLIAPLGAGSQARVFRVEDLDEERLLALKLLRGGEPTELFRWEFAQLRELSHPNLSRVWDLDIVRRVDGDPRGVTVGAPFLTQDLVSGAPAHLVAARNMDGQIDSHWVAAVGAAVCRALYFLHERGIVHRDVKPANVLVADDPSAATLIDLGLSTAVGDAAGLPAGTMAYMAPEALAGAVEPRSDLWSLGVSLFEMISGRLPFDVDSADVGALIRAAFEGRRLSLVDVAPGVDPALAALIDGLLTVELHDRPSSARQVLDQLGRRLGPSVLGLDGGAAAEVAAAGGDAARFQPLIFRRGGALIGRAAEVELLSTLVAERLDPLRSGSPTIVVTGPAGVGKSALIREALDRLKLRALGRATPSPMVLRGSTRVIAAALRDEVGPSSSTPRLDAWLGASRGGSVTEGAAPPDAAVLSEELALLATVVAVERPLVLHVETANDGLGRALWTSLHRRAEFGVGSVESSPMLAVLAEMRREPGQELGLPTNIPVVESRLLLDEEIRAIAEDRLGSARTEALIHTTVAAARGRPLLALATLSQALELGPLEQLDEQALARLRPTTDAVAAVAASAAVLSDSARNALVALSIWNRPAGSRELGHLLDLAPDDAVESIGELWRSQWIELDAEGCVVPVGEDLALAVDLDDELLRSLHRRAMGLLTENAPNDLPSRARHALAAEVEEASVLALEAGSELLAAGDTSGAIELLEAAAADADSNAAPRAGVELRRALFAAGRYDAVADLWRQQVEAGEPRAGIHLARSLRLGGRADAAHDAAVNAAATDPWGAKALLARLELDRGLAREALDVLGAPVAGEATGGSAAEFEEVAGLAQLRLGAVDAAEEHFEACLSLAEAGGDPVLTARAHNLLGMVGHRRERWSDVASHAGKAERLARAAGHTHAAATYGVNVAVALIESGDLASALPSLRQAVTTLASLGRAGELANALFNFASLLSSLGDVESALRVCRRARTAARDACAEHVLAYCDLLEAELLVRPAAMSADDLVLASKVVDRALGAFVELEAPHEEDLARLLRAEILAKSTSHAEEALVEVEAVAGGSARGKPELSARVALISGRLAVSGVGDPRAAEDRIAEARQLLDDRKGGDLGWRLAVTKARLVALRGDHAGALRDLEEALRAIAERRRHVPLDHLDRWERDPDRLEAAGLVNVLGAGSELQPRSLEVLSRTSPRTVRPHALRRLLDINKRLNSELRLGRLLDEIIDTIVQLTDAERGFLLLRDREGVLRPRSARNVDRRSLVSDDLRLSRSIAERVVETGEPVLTVDARADGRFDTAESVHALRLRSILAVPLRVKGEVVGAVYVDDQLRPNAFGEDAMALVLDVADQAAIAIENARLLAENKRRQRKIEGLNRRLHHEIDRQKVELNELRRELDGQRHELANKYSYDAIVARSAEMTKVFRVLDRVTDSEVPVVIQGESGTGKELVARAIHFNGPRQKHPFVTENCGAIPETLLESVLFGHVRGAYTGADRSRQGLFEVASGGTLLLDEISEMTPAMQAKLLRVLQEGELRPVGGDRLIQVDVRVITSSNQNLSELVQRGEFREDLFYRLNVITVRLPPLRDRSEDVSLLVEHFIAKHGGGRVGAVDRTALRCLTAYAWPGNVRQLENEVMRATVLADDLIREEHLSPEIVEGATNSPRPDDLDLRAHVAHLERDLIAKALERFNNNQSRAAKALGLSRYGLQKKLIRYDMRPTR